MIRKLVRGGGFALAMAIPLLHIGVSCAQDAAQIAAGIINVERVERRSIAWKSLSEQINAERAKLQAEIQELQSSLEAKGKELETQRSILSSEAFAAKAQEFQQERLKLQREANLRKQKLDHAYGVARSQIRDALKEVLAEIAEEKKLNLILESGSRTTPVLIFDSNLSIDDEALNGLNAKIQSVSLPAAAPAAQ